MDYLGRITGSQKDKQPKPDHPVIRKLADSYEAITNEHFEQVNRMCGSNVKAAHESVARFVNVPPLAMYDEAIADKAMSCLTEELRSLLEGSRMVSLDEAIQDSELKKNPGLPWSRKYATKEDVALKERPLLYDYWHTHLPKGEMNFWIDWALKVEMRNVDKIAQNKLRTIAMMSVDHVLFSKMFMLDIARKINSAGYERHGMAFGFNPFYGGMGRFAQYLGGLENSKGWEFDVAKMDANVHQWIMQRICWMLFEFLSPVYKTADNRARWQNLVNALCMCPIVLPDGTVWLKGADGFGGNPSGQFLTSIVNSLFSKFLVYYVFIKQGGYQMRLEPTIISELKKRTRVAIVGDDLTYTTDLEWFSGSTYGTVLYQDFGIVLETPSEEGRHWFTLGFLGFKFAWDEETRQIIFKLRPNNVYSSMLTIGKGQKDTATGLPPPEVTLDRLCSLRLVSWGDPRVRTLLRYVIDGFIAEYDEQLYDQSGESEWEKSKNKVWSDAVLRRLFTGYQCTHASSAYDDAVGAMVDDLLRQ